MSLGHPLTWLDRVGVVWLSLVARRAHATSSIEDPARHLPKRNWQWFGLGLRHLAARSSRSARWSSPTCRRSSGRGAAVHIVVRPTSAARPCSPRCSRASRPGSTTVGRPSNLHPDPAAAAHDRPAADRRPTATPTSRPSSRALASSAIPPAPTPRVLFGDSHADSGCRPSTRPGRAQHWKIVNWTKSACPAAQLTVFSSSLNRHVHRMRHLADPVLRPGSPPSSRTLIFVSESENVVDAQRLAGRVDRRDDEHAERRCSTTTRRKVVFMQDIPVPGLRHARPASRSI